MLSDIRPHGNNTHDLESANRIYYASRLRMHKEYERITKQCHDATPHRRVMNEAVRKEINDWVANKTRNRIRDVLKRPISKDVESLLVNAMYFKADWIRKFLKVSALFIKCAIILDYVP